MRMLLFVLFPALFLTNGIHKPAQRSPEQVLELRHRCFDAMQHTPSSAESVCRKYLERSADDDPRPVQGARDWLAAYDRVQPYVKALSSLSSSDNDRPWLVYEPDLSLVIPEVVENEGNYKIDLHRSIDTPAEELLLRKAEAVYESPSKMIETLLRNARLLAERLPKDNEPLWWIAGNDNMRMTTVVTARAVMHYYNLSLELRRNPAAVPGFTTISTNLKYRATVKHYDTYAHGDAKFKDVYVADLNLEWGSICGGLCGMGFTRNKLVVLSPGGDVLAMYLDAPVNSTSWVS